jgi:putative endonuclease
MVSQSFECWVNKNMNWQVYIIVCTDNSLYTGITTDVERRFSEHIAGKQGARYFHGRTPEKVVYLESAHNRSTASKREAAIKKLLRADKLCLIDSAANELNAAGVRLRT